MVPLGKKDQILSHLGHLKSLMAPGGSEHSVLQAFGHSKHTDIQVPEAPGHSKGTRADHKY